MSTKPPSKYDCPSCHSLMRATGERREVGWNHNPYSPHSFIDETYRCTLCGYIKTFRLEVDED